MRYFFTIAFFINFSLVFAQNNDSLRQYVNRISAETVNAYYDKLSSKIVISPVFEDEIYKVEIYDITGTPVQTLNAEPSGNNIEISIWLKPGVYILNVYNHHFKLTRKFRVSS